MASKTHTAFIRNAALALSMSVMLVAACGGDTDIDPETGSESEDPSTPGTEDDADDSDDDSTSSADSDTQQNACGADAVNMDDACETCIATQCTAEALACCQAPGCLDVVRCAAENECDGVDCYTPDACQAEIDAAGIDVAMNQATELGACALDRCATECGVDDLAGG